MGRPACGRSLELLLRFQVLKLLDFLDQDFVSVKCASAPCSGNPVVATRYRRLHKAKGPDSEYGAEIAGRGNVNVATGSTPSITEECSCEVKVSVFSCLSRKCMRRTPPNVHEIVGSVLP